MGVDLIERIALERNCSPQLVRAIINDFIATHHETCVKRGAGQSFVDSYWQLGPEGAWHFMGLCAEIADCEAGEVIEHYQRLDSSLKRFSSIHTRWMQELEADRTREE